MNIFPAIDIIDGKCVRLTKGIEENKTIYKNSPIDMAKIYQDAPRLGRRRRAFRRLAHRAHVRRRARAAPTAVAELPDVVLLRELARLAEAYCRLPLPPAAKFRH